MTGVGGLVGMPLVYVTCMIEGLPTDDAVADRMVMVMMLRLTASDYPNQVVVKECVGSLVGHASCPLIHTMLFSVLS